MKLVLLLILTVTSVHVLATDQPVIGSEIGFGSSTPNSKTSVTRESLLEIKSQAEAGNENSQYFLGLLYLYGSDHLVPKSVNRAMTYFRASAVKGHVEAQLALGLIFTGTYGPAKDTTASFAWLKKAAEQGNSEAQWLLGRLFYDGDLPDTENPSMKKARNWFKLSAEQNNANGMFYLGLMTEYGVGGAVRDFSVAAKWYDKAVAADNHMEAKYYLGLLYLQGRGVRKNTAKAVQLISDSAKDMHAPAMLMLGRFFAEGKGVEINYQMAMVWLDRAIESDHPQVVTQARELRGALASITQDAKQNALKVSEEYLEENIKVEL